MELYILTAEGAIATRGGIFELDSDRGRNLCSLIANSS